MVDRENMVSTYMGMGVAIPHGTSNAKETVKKSGIVVMQYPEGVDFGDETLKKNADVDTIMKTFG